MLEGRVGGKGGRGGVLGVVVVWVGKEQEICIRGRENITG